MEMRKCDVCGEEYSATYRSCPFCEEQEAIRRGKPIHRHTSDFRNRRGGHALGVLALVLALVVIGAGARISSGRTSPRPWGCGSRPTRRTPATRTPAAVPPSDSGAARTPTRRTASCPAWTTARARSRTDGGRIEPATPPSTPVALSSQDFTLDAANGLQYTLKATGGSGTYTWTSADPSVATVSESGTGHRRGQRQHRGHRHRRLHHRRLYRPHQGDHRRYHQHPPPAPATLSLNREDMTMPAGTTFQLKVSGTTSAVTWSIADTSIATIDADGTVHFVKKGTTTATASVDGQTLQCIVRVTVERSTLTENPPPGAGFYCAAPRL